MSTYLISFIHRRLADKRGVSKTIFFRRTFSSLSLEEGRPPKEDFFLRWLMVILKHVLFFCFTDVMSCNAYSATIIFFFIFYFIKVQAVAKKKD